VLPGPCDSFMLERTTGSNVLQRSFEKIDNVEVIFRDSGLNVVSGNATMTIVSRNASVVLSPALSFDVSSNVSANSKAFVPPFFVTINNWNAWQPVQTIEIRVNQSTLPSYGASSLFIDVNATCQPGQRIVSSGLKVSSGIFSVSAHCEVCKVLFTSIYYDSSDCVSLLWTFPDLPTFVTSGIPLRVANVKTANEGGELMTKTIGWNVRISLVRFNQNTTSSIINGYLDNGVIAPVVIPIPVYADKPAADYAWKLELIVNKGDAVLTVFLPSEKNVRVLDFAPFVHSAAPRALSFAGSSGITLSSSFLPIRSSLEIFLCHQLRSFISAKRRMPFHSRATGRCPTSVFLPIAPSIQELKLSSYAVLCSRHLPDHRIRCGMQSCCCRTAVSLAEILL